MVLVLQFKDDATEAERDDPPDFRGRETGNLVGHATPKHDHEMTAPAPLCPQLGTSLHHLQDEDLWRVIGGKLGVGNADAANTVSSLKELSAEHASNDQPHQDNSAGSLLPRIARLLTAYPIVISIVSHLDQTDLYNLALSCHTVRLNLGQFRSQALAHTLRCANESAPRDRGSVSSRWRPLCARDLVAPCRRCGSTVCRNCMAKPAGGLRPTGRFRRLCRTCQRIPLAFFGIGVDESEVGTISLEGALTARGPCQCASIGLHICRSCDQGQAGADTTYTRVWSWRNRYRNLGFGLGTGVGEGNEGVKCGRGAACLAARDLIVDIDGAEAGRSGGAQVLGAIGISTADAGASPAANTAAHASVHTNTLGAEHSSVTSAIFVGSSMADAGGSSSHGDAGPIHAYPRLASPTSALGTASALSLSSPNALSAALPSAVAQRAQSHAHVVQHDEAAGYYRHEVEGIGGVVKKKLKKRVRVGATVTEYEDESQNGTFLHREHSGLSRSWCAWCDRIIPSLSDLGSIAR